MMNKEEAKQAWCPMVRMHRTDFFASPLALAFNRIEESSSPPVAELPEAACCVSDRCAMWRWAEPEPEMPEIATWHPPDELFDDEGLLKISVEPERPAEVPADAVWEPQRPDLEKGWHDGGYWIECAASHDKRQAVELAKRRGYCGLAGRPT